MSEADLWQNVLRRALVDARYRGKDYENVMAQRFAHDWIVYGGRDFEIVCTFAGVDPDMFRAAYIAKYLR